MPISKFTLANGVRVVVEPITHVQSAAVGLWCVTGSRHERPEEAGITHLIEHMLFKGTRTRSAREIAEAIEGRGGSLNAFTDKENTCYYARVLKEDVGNAIDVLSDMMTDSLFDPEELAREEGVVLEEIKRGEDEPGDQVHDLHYEYRWHDHVLGKPVIGTKESVSSFKRDHLLAYMARRYRADNVVLAVSGNVQPAEVAELADAVLGVLPKGTDSEQLAAPKGKHALHMVDRDVEQVHFCIGSDGCSLHEPDLYVASVMDAALGGSMSSRLFQEIREKRGLAYAIGSYSLFYTSGGAYTVYGGTSLEQWPLVQELVAKEFAGIVKGGLSPEELSRTKTNLKGNTVMALEGTSSRMMRLARAEIFHRREIPIEETLARIEAVTNDDIVRYATKVLDPSAISVTAIGPFKD